MLSHAPLMWTTLNGPVFCTHTHAHVPPHTHTHVPTHTHTHMYPHTHTCTRTHTHTRMYPHTHTHACTHTHTHVPTHTHTHMYPYTHTHTHMYPHTHTYSSCIHDAHLTCSACTFGRCFYPHWVLPSWRSMALWCSWMQPMGYGHSYNYASHSFLPTDEYVWYPTVCTGCALAKSVLLYCWFYIGSTWQ